MVAVRHAGDRQTKLLIILVGGGGELSRGPTKILATEFPFPVVEPILTAWHFQSPRDMRETHGSPREAKMMGGSGFHSEYICNWHSCTDCQNSGLVTMAVTRRLFEM